MGDCRLELAAEMAGPVHENANPVGLRLELPRVTSVKMQLSSFEIPASATGNFLFSKTKTERLAVHWFAGLVAVKMNWPGWLTVKFCPSAAPKMPCPLTEIHENWRPFGVAATSIWVKFFKQVNVSGGAERVSCGMPESAKAVAF